MDKAEVIKLVEQTLRSVDEGHVYGLVNFVDDTISWKEIAAVAVDVITNQFDEVPWEQQ